MKKKLFIFAIGGTGERVLRSLTMLFAAGVESLSNYDVYPIIIDYDLKNADKQRTVELLRNYKKIHNAAFMAHGELGLQDRQFFAADLRGVDGMEDYVFPFKPAQDNIKFRDYIGYGKFAGDTLLTEDLLRSLYDDSQRPDTELNLDMTVGFKGNPNIGSVVFNSIASTNEFRNFLNHFQPEQEDKVVIIGSLFGGTGAAGIPEITKAINAKKEAADIATVLVLPYFSPMEQKDGAVRADRFNSKTKAALSYYKNSGILNQINRVYYIGDPHRTIIRYSEGGDTQKNNANVVELIAAMMIEHFAAGRGDATQKEYKFSIDASITEDNIQKSAQRLFTYDFDPISINKVLLPLIRLAIALKFFHESIWGKKTSGQDFHKYLKLNDAIEVNEANGDKSRLTVLCTTLEKFYKQYQGWLKELDFEGDGTTIPGNSHRFALTDMKKPYADLILRPAATDKEAQEPGFWQRLSNLIGNSNTKPVLTDDNLMSWMNGEFRDNGNGNGHYDTKRNTVREGHEPEYVFADILYKASDKGLRNLISSTN